MEAIEGGAAAAEGGAAAEEQEPVPGSTPGRAFFSIALRGGEKYFKYGFESRSHMMRVEAKEMEEQITPPDPSILDYILRVYKADEARGELVGHALVFEREMNAWIDSLEEKEEDEK